MSLGQSHCLFQFLRNTKITQLDNSVLASHDVGSLDVSMEDFSVVNMLQTEKGLCEPAENLSFFELLQGLL